RRPRVSGAAAEAGKIYVTQRFQQALVKAEDEAKRLKDEYVSVEHLWLGLVDAAAGAPLGRLLRQLSIDRDRTLASLQQVRGSQRVTSANPEVAYEALAKYGVDLVEQ